MAEVLLGTKPGKPVLTLLIAAGALLTALGGAYWQVQHSRALAEPCRIPGTPLEIRPPRGWIADPKVPGLFIQPVKIVSRGREQWVPDRRIRIGYKRWGTFRPLMQLLELNNLIDRARGEQPEPARIGGFRAVQVTRQRVFRTPWGREVGQTVYRLTCSPRGDEISVEYLPLREIAPGDLALLDAVCEAIRIKDSAFERSGLDWPRLAGLACATPPGWEMCGPDMPGAPGFYVQGATQGVPDWTLGVFRTWLAPGRAIEALASDYRANPRGDFPEEVALSPWSLDGLSGVAFVPDRLAPDAWVYHAAWFGQDEQQNAVVLLLFSGPNAIEPAQRAADELLASLAFAEPAPWPDLSDAEQAGRDLVQRIGAAGLKNWWGEQPLRRRYAGADLSQPLRLDVVRQFTESVEGALYSGAERLVWQDDSSWDLCSWTADVSGRSYVHSLSRPVGGPSSREVRVFDERRHDAEPFIERRGRGGRERVPVGPSFVAPPIEILAEWLVSRDRPGGAAAMIEVSSREYGGTHFRLLLPQAPDAQGHSRVLLLDDFLPSGGIAAFDEGGELVFERNAYGYVERLERP